MKTKSNRFWLLLLGGILILCLAFTAYVYYRGSQVPEVTITGPVAVVYLDGEIADVVDLGVVEESYTKTFTGKSGNSNTVEYSHGRVRVDSASCPDQVCVGQGWLNEKGILPIACLPNSLIVEVIPAEELQTDVDSSTR